MIKTVKVHLPKICLSNWRSCSIFVAIFAFLLLGLTSCTDESGSGQWSRSAWGWYVVSPFTEQGRANLKFLMDGYKFTILISVVSILLSLTIGFMIGLAGLSDQSGIKRINRIYVGFIRAIPLLPFIFWIHYGLPVLTGVTLDVFWSGVLALALSDSAFEAEIFRGGLQSIGKGQIEAAKALGLTRSQALRRIILPQALRRILPPLGNQFVYMLKMSSLVSVLGLQELTSRAEDLVTNEYRSLEIYTILILEYFVLIVVVSKGVRLLEQRYGSDERQN